MRILFTSSTFSKKFHLFFPGCCLQCPSPGWSIACETMVGTIKIEAPDHRIFTIKKKKNMGVTQKIETYLRKCQTAHLEGYQSNNSREYHGISTGIERECISNNMLYVYIYIHNIYIYMYTYMRTYYYYIYIHIYSMCMRCVWDINTLKKKNGCWPDGKVVDMFETAWGFQDRRASPPERLPARFHQPRWAKIRKPKGCWIMIA